MSGTVADAKDIIPDGIAPNGEDFGVITTYSSTGSSFCAPLLRCSSTLPAMDFKSSLILTSGGIAIFGKMIGDLGAAVGLVLLRLLFAL